MRKHFGRVVPPERPLELVDPPQAAADRAAATETAPAFARFFALATPGVEQLRGDSAAVDRRWDRATHDWSVFVRLEDVRGAKLKAEGMLAVMGGNYVVTVGARLREPRSRGGHEVKSAPAAKDWLEHGAEWGAGAEAGADRGGGLIVVHGAARRSTGFLRLNVYERSRTDLFETYQLGHVDVPLLDVPVVRNPAAPPRRPPSAGLRTFPLQRKSLLTGRPSANWRRGTQTPRCLRDSGSRVYLGRNSSDVRGRLDPVSRDAAAIPSSRRRRDTGLTPP